MKKKLVYILMIAVLLIGVLAGCTGDPNKDATAIVDYINANPSILDQVDTSSLKGDKGDTGPAGVPGERGPAGPAGANGSNGIDGTDGAPGPKGDTGATGPAGAGGATGPQGPAGPTGPAGFPGATGATGATGTPGSLTASSFARMVQHGGLRLIETQNVDGGWDWGDMTGTTSISADASPKNTVGVTAMGLLKAYAVTGYDGYLDAAELAAAYITDNQLAGERLRGPDMTFLVELSTVTGNPAYLATAQAGWAAILTNPAWSSDGTATAFGNFMVTGRGGDQIAAWDLNLYVVALNALGYAADAGELATVTNTLLAGALNPAGDYYAIALSGAIKTYTVTGLFTGDIPALTAALLALQTPNGAISSPDSDVQATAYAIMALGSGNPAVLGMADFLYSAQTPVGGWMDAGGEYTEADSEAVCALFMLIP